MPTPATRLGPLPRLAALLAPLALAAAGAQAADPAADYERSLAAVAEVDGVVMHLQDLAEKRRSRRPAEMQACLDDKLAEARKLQKIAGQAHGRMVEAIADRKEKAAWDQYRAVVQVQAQARKLRGGAEVCRMLTSADEHRPAPRPQGPAAAPASQPGPAHPSGPASGPGAAAATTSALSAAVVGAFELELD